MAHIRQRPDRGEGVWQVTVAAGRDPVTRRYRQVTRTLKAGPPTAKGNPPQAVLKLAARLQTEADRGRYQGSGSTLGFLLGEYVQAQKTRGRSPKTVAGYDSLRRLICDRDGPGQGIADIPLDKLTARHVDALDMRLADAGRSQTTRAHYSAFIRQAVEQAINWGFLDRNPIRGAERPTLEPAPVDPPTVQQIAALIAAARAQGNADLGSFIYCAAALGARRGELCGLQWRDIEPGHVVIRRTVSDTSYGVQVVPRTKTNRIRRLAIGSETAAVLDDQRDRTREHTGLPEPPPEAFVWSMEEDHLTPWRPDKVTKAFTALRDGLGLGHVHLHSLRHAAVTRALGAGVDLRTAASRFGHDPTLMTKVYAHAIETADQLAAATAELGLLTVPVK